MSLPGLPLFHQSAFPSKARGSAVAPPISSGGANYSNAFATPVSERRLVHVSKSPGAFLDEAPPFRGERLLTDLATGRSASRVSCDHLSSHRRNYSAGRTQAADSTNCHTIAVAFRLMPLGLFPCPPTALQSSVGDFSERFEHERLPSPSSLAKDFSQCLPDHGKVFP